MPRGRQYYDPIEQHPAIVGGQKDLARIELYPEGGPDEPSPRWCARRITADGLIAEHAPGDFDHDRALAQAQALWANLPIYELRNEGEDSTWEGMGPSPRMWTNAVAAAGVTKEQFKEVLHEAANVVETHQGSSPGDADGASREPSPMGPLPDPVGTRLGPGDDIPPAGELHVLPIAEPGTYVRISDVLALLYLWESQYEEEKNPSAAMALREARETIATSLQGGRDG